MIKEAWREFNLGIQTITGKLLETYNDETRNPFINLSAGINN